VIPAAAAGTNQQRPHTETYNGSYKLTVSGPGSGGVFNGKIGPGTIKCNGVTISYNGTLKLSRIAKSYSAGSPVRQFFRQAVIRHK
jgi:hypothetical protein